MMLTSSKPSTGVVAPTDIDCSTNPNYPAASAGARYRVTVAGKIGGASGKDVEVGDVAEAIADNAGGTEAAVGTSWIVMQGNVVGLGTMSTQNAASVAITGGTIAGITAFGLRNAGTGAYDLTLEVNTTFTAARALTLVVPDEDVTLTIPGTGTVAMLGIANEFTAAQTLSVNGAANAPALSLTGTPFTGGTATTTKPLALIETSGATSTGWSTNGTMLGVNSPSGFAGRLVDFQLNGTRRFDVDYNGVIYNYGGIQFQETTNATAVSKHGNGLLLTAEFTFSTKIIADGMQVASTMQYGWTNATSYGGTLDTGLRRLSAGVVKVTNGSSGYGAIDASAFSVSGSAGASFSGAITNLTVVNGIVTAAS